MPWTSFTLAGWPETKKEKNKGRSNFPPGTVHRYGTGDCIYAYTL